MMPLIYRKKTMAAAWDDVKRNKGGPGVDGESVEAFGTNVKQRLWELSEALRTHAWHPKPLRRVWIPKPDGTQRGLAVPCVEDRVVHAAVARVLYAVFEDAFGPDCYAYVHGRSALDAIARIQRDAAAGKRWGLDELVCGAGEEFLGLPYAWCRWGEARGGSVDDVPKARRPDAWWDCGG